MSKNPKFPISDVEMQVLLKKYPFLRYRNVWTGEQTFHGKSKNLETNYYKEWDGSGWEDLWKNRYLPRLFKAYDHLSKSEKKQFGFCDVKEKYGGLRICTKGSVPGDLESIAETLSEWTCEFCGKEPREHGLRVIWTTDGWITNLCEDCAREYLKTRYNIPENKIEAKLAEIKNIQEKPFGYKRYSKANIITVLYKETDDGWLQEDIVIEEPRIDNKIITF